ncbi:MAG: c-type cytochrome [Leptospira sp.]|nr:c-type cytochrome [Leptospira sp.]
MRLSRFVPILLLLLLPFCKANGILPTENNSSSQDNLTLSILLAGFDLQEEAKRKIGSLPLASPRSESDSKEKIALGEKIFKDNSLSLNSVQSCSTCHLLTGRNVGTDGQATSLGTFGQAGKRNTPTIFNVGFLETIFWDGRKSNLEDQALLPFVDSSEMALGSTSDLLTRLNAKSEYSTLFAKAFPESPSIQLSSVKTSISAFERSLISRSRFDDFVDGNPYAISLEEKEGLRLFLNLNCVDCHNSSMLGGSKFVKLDTIYTYNPNDLGRFEVTGIEADRFVFRTPSLRNVALTQPYFHDGSVRTLDEAVRRMNEYNSPRMITEREVTLLVAFLKSLSDRSKANF